MNLTDRFSLRSRRVEFFVGTVPFNRFTAPLGMITDAESVTCSVPQARYWDAMPDPELIVAVVDDDPSMLSSIGCLLNAHGFAIEKFTSAEDFLLRKSPNRPACLILDINLSGMSGIELARIIADSDAPIPIIFITASDDKATCARANVIGCVEYLRKPFQSRLLIDAIAKAKACSH